MASTTVGLRPPLEKAVYRLMDGVENLKKLENLLSSPKCHGNITWNGHQVFYHEDYCGEVSIEDFNAALCKFLLNKKLASRTLDKNIRVLLNFTDAALSKLEQEANNIYRSSDSIFKFLNHSKDCRYFHNLRSIAKSFFLGDYLNTFGQNHPLPAPLTNMVFPVSPEVLTIIGLHATDQDMWDLEDEYRRANGLPLPFRAIFTQVNDQQPSRL